MRSIISQAMQVISEASCHSRCVVMFRLGGEAADAMLGLVASVDQDDLYVEDGKFGREDEPHVTILYGIKDSSDLDVVRNIISEREPFQVKFGKMSVFEGDGYEVLKVEVDGEGLRSLHEILKEKTDNDWSWPSYRAHATVAYLKPGKSSKYTDLPVEDQPLHGMTSTVSEVIFKDKDGMPHALPLADQSLVALESDSIRDVISELVVPKQVPQKLYRGVHGDHVGDKTKLLTLSMTDSPYVAKTYARFQAPGSEKTIRLLTYSSSLSKPLAFRKKSHDGVVLYGDLVKIIGNEALASSIAKKQYWTTPNDPKSGQEDFMAVGAYTDLSGLMESKEFINWAKSAGYDCIMYAGQFGAEEELDGRSDGSFDAENDLCLEVRPLDMSKVKLIKDEQIDSYDERNT